MVELNITKENKEEPLLLDGTSYLDGVTYHDVDILNYVGIKNYIALSIKYPSFFQHFRYINKESYMDIISPSDVLISLPDDPRIIKSDIIKTVHYKKYISRVSDLVINIEKNKILNLIMNDEIHIWIIFCLVMVFLIFISCYVVSVSPSFKKLFKDTLSKS